MKKIFIFLSTIVILIFFLFQINQTSDGFLFDLTDNVTLDQGSQEIKRGDLNTSLNHYALKHHSLVIKLIVIPGQSNVYQKFGKGELTEGLKEASAYQQNTSSEISQYLIIKGPLTNQQLGDYFKEWGYEVRISNKQPLLLVAMQYLASNSLLLIFLIFILTFVALTIILRIKDLRSAGIRLVSGESIWSIMASSVKSDALFITLSFLFSNGIGFLMFWGKGWLHLPYWKPLLVALFIYDFLLILISFLLSLVYLLGLKKSDLLSIIKGKLPLKRLIGIMSFCQLIAIIIVGFGINRIPVYYAELLEEKKAANEWHKLDQRFNLMTSGATSIYDKNEPANWYNLQKDVIENYDAILVKNNFSVRDNIDGLREKPYGPEGNTFFVTPNYLKYENIKLDAKSRDKLNHLKLGEYGLILPQKLKAKTKKYQKLYDQHFSYLTAKEVKISPVITYVPNQQERFAYNNNGIRPQQFVKDPIIMVLTPQSTGNNLNSHRFWKSTGVYYSFYRGYKQTIRLTKKHHLYKKIAEISDSQQNYEREVRFFRNQTITFFIGAIFGVITSAILFNSMSILYFEEFRRDIFIKRISGMNFLEIHFNYLLTQLAVMIFGLAFNIFTTKNIGTSLITFAIFLANMLFILIYQMKKENNFAVTVLKGM
ncbi:MAG: DUF1430 domain-containing protein [Lactobacillaceae bacterium]